MTKEKRNQQHVTELEKISRQRKDAQNALNDYIVHYLGYRFVIDEDGAFERVDVLLLTEWQSAGNELSEQLLQMVQQFGRTRWSALQAKGGAA